VRGSIPARYMLSPVRPTVSGVLSNILVQRFNAVLLHDSLPVTKCTD